MPKTTRPRRSGPGSPACRNRRSSASRPRTISGRWASSARAGPARKSSGITARASPEARGYVLRRIMRRAMRHAHMLGSTEPLMWRLVPALVQQMGAAFPELIRAQPLVTETLRLEEEGFKQTLDRGLRLLEEAAAGPGLADGGKTLDGGIAFTLYDTYGFPLDLTQDILRPRGIAVDTAKFDTEVNAARAR